MRKYTKRILKGLERIPEQREQWEQDWNNDEIEKWIDVHFRHKTLFQSKQDYIIRRYQNRKSEIETLVAIRKLKRHLASKKYKEFIDRHFNKTLPNAQYNEKVEFVRDLLDKIQDLDDKYTKEIVQKYIEEDRNVNHINTKNGIQYQVNKRIQQEIGYNPEEFKGKSVKHLVSIIFPNFEKPQRPSLAEQDKSCIFDKNNDELTPIEKLGRDDPVKYASTMFKIHELRRSI